MDVCGSLWFPRFMEGLKAQMGQLWLPNNGLSNELRSELYTKIKEKIQESKTYSEEQHRWIVLGFYTATVYVVSLRNPEGLILDLDELN